MARHSSDARQVRQGRTSGLTCSVAGVVSCLAMMAPAAAIADCRQALVFALDVSASVDEIEYRQQLDGLAGALEDPAVTDAILGDPAAPMAVAAFEWSNRDYATLIVEWTVIESMSDVELVAASLRAWERTSAPRETALGAGLEMAAALLQRAPECWEHTVDISADGKNNDGPPPSEVYSQGVLSEATVNALVVGTAGGGTPEAVAELERIRTYLEENVVRGPGSFVAVAQSYEDYTRAMRQKLLKEVAGPMVAPMPRGGSRG